MKKSIILFSLAALIAAGCNNAGNENDHQHHSEHINDHEHEHEHHEDEHHDDEHGSAAHEHQEDGEVMLNNGERWEANPETTEGVKSMAMEIKTYKSSGDAKDKTELHNLLTGYFNMIFEKCTMKGEAHNQLHNYLIPLNDMMAELENCTDEKCDEIIDEMESHLEKYDKYFD